MRRKNNQRKFFRIAEDHGWSAFKYFKIEGVRKNEKREHIYTCEKSEKIIY